MFNVTIQLWSYCVLDCSSHRYTCVDLILALLKHVAVLWSTCTLYGRICKPLYTHTTVCSIHRYIEDRYIEGIHAIHLTSRAACVTNLKTISVKIPCTTNSLAANNTPSHVTQTHLRNRIETLNSVSLCIQAHVRCVRDVRVSCGRVCCGESACAVNQRWA
jgi:hypothetical protein